MTIGCPGPTWGPHPQKISIRPFGRSTPSGSCRCSSGSVLRVTDWPGCGVTSGNDGPMCIVDGIRCSACGAPDGAWDDPSRKSSVRIGPWGPRPIIMPNMPETPPPIIAPSPEVVSAVIQ